MRRELNNAAASEEKGYSRSNSFRRVRIAICMWLLFMQGWRQGLVLREDARQFQAIGFRRSMSSTIPLALEPGNQRNNLRWSLQTGIFSKTLLVSTGWPGIFCAFYSPPPPLCYLGTCGSTPSHSLPIQQSLMSFILIKVYLINVEQRYWCRLNDSPAETIVQRLKAGLIALIKILLPTSFLPGTLKVIKSRKDFSSHLVKSWDHC